MLAKVYYHTHAYSHLCFKHAVEEANLGNRVITEVDLDESYMQCPKCKERREDKK